MGITELSDLNFEFNKNKIFIKHPIIANKRCLFVVVANWCSHCQNLKPVLQQINNTLGVSFPIVFIEETKYSNFVNTKLKISSFPSLFFVNNTGLVYKPLQNNSYPNLIKNICSEVRIC